MEGKQNKPAAKSAVIDVRQSVTQANDFQADLIRQDLSSKGIWVLNLVSSPGAGKTCLIEQTIKRLEKKEQVLVIEGDPYTSLDTQRIKALGARGIQINTQGGCHLDAQMIKAALKQVDLEGVCVVIIENVGNLLCPAAWDLGQHDTVVIASPTEGADKPLKYPDAFIRAQALVVNKIDLLPYLPPSCAGVEKNAKSVNAGLTIFNTSCITGKGLNQWMDWVQKQMSKIKANISHA